MATVKNINSDYTISVKSGAGNVIIDGNLDVYGNITYVADLAVNDAFIITAANNTGNISDGGLIFQIDSGNYAGLRFDSTSKFSINDRFLILFNLLKVSNFSSFNKFKKLLLFNSSNFFFDITYSFCSA